MSVSPTWVDAGDPRVQAEAADYRDWWQAFNDPALNGLIERAYRENLSLRIAGARVLQARAQLGITAGELYPQTQQTTRSLEYNRVSERAPQAVFGQGVEHWQSEIGVAKADLYAALSRNGTFGFLSSDVGNFGLGDMFAWRSRMAQAGPSLQWNIFNYGRITNNVRLQDARLQELLLAYQNTVLTAQREVADNLIAFLKAQDRAEFLARSTAFAKSALDLAVLQYREGTKDFTTVLTAQQALLNEQDNLASTLGDISINLVGVYRALGGGWEIREGKDLLPSEVRAEMAKRTNWGKLLAPASYNPPVFEEPQSPLRLPDW